MKKIIHSILFLSTACVLAISCSNGAYTANPTDPANDGVNPLKPLTADEFTWTGTAPMSATINGTAFKADTAYWFLDSSGTNVFIGKQGKKQLAFYLNSVYAVNVYSMAYHIYKIQALYTETSGDTAKLLSTVYASALGNSGEVKVTQNDSAYIAGQFYFNGVTQDGTQSVTVSKGYFKIAKQ